MVKKKQKSTFEKNYGAEILIGIFALMIIVLLIMVFVKTGEKKFENRGIPFKLTYEGELVFYTALIPVLDDFNRIISVRTVDFTMDPRKNDVPVEVQEFHFTKKTYVSYDKNLNGCEDNTLAAVNLGRFLSSGIGLEVKGATNNPDYINSTGLEYVTCEKNKNSTVVLLKSGEETKISEQDGCYIITSKDCEIIEATEAFGLAVLKQYMASLG